MKPFPATEESASVFVATLYREGLAGGSVKSYLVLADCFETGGPEKGRVASLELHCERVQEEGRWAQEETSFPDYPHSIAETKDSVGRNERLLQCQNAVGSSLPLFFWIFKVGGSGGALSEDLRPGGALECRRCEGKQYGQAIVFGSMD